MEIIFIRTKHLITMKHAAPVSPPLKSSYPLLNPFLSLRSRIHFMNLDVILLNHVSTDKIRRLYFFFIHLYPQSAEHFLLLNLCL